MRNLTPQQAQAEIARGARLLDVREHEELQLASIQGAAHIPMGEIPSRLAELDTGAPIVVLCHHGGRSMQVARYLERNGFGDVINVAGGIEAWSVELDPSVPRY